MDLETTYMHTYTHSIDLRLPLAPFTPFGSLCRLLASFRALRLPSAPLRSISLAFAPFDPLWHPFNPFRSLSLPFWLVSALPGARPDLFACFVRPQSIYAPPTKSLQNCPAQPISDPAKSTRRHIPPPPRRAATDKNLMFE